MLADWRIDGTGQIAPGFGNMMEAGMSGRVGNTVTLNGAPPADQPVRAGERIRLRLLNSSLARIMALRFDGHDPVIIARDGQPCDPHAIKDGRLLLGPAMRVDLLVDMKGEPGGRYRITDDFYEGLGYELTRFAYSGETCNSDHGVGADSGFRRIRCLEPDLADAQRHELTLEGGMMSRMMGGGDGMMRGMGGMSDMGQRRLVDQRHVHDRRRPRGHGAAVQPCAPKKLIWSPYATRPGGGTRCTCTASASKC